MNKQNDMKECLSSFNSSSNEQTDRYKYLSPLFYRTDKYTNMKEHWSHGRHAINDLLKGNWKPASPTQHVDYWQCVVRDSLRQICKLPFDKLPHQITIRHFRERPLNLATHFGNFLSLEIFHIEFKNNIHYSLGYVLELKAISVLRNMEKLCLLPLTIAMNTNVSLTFKIHV